MEQTFETTELKAELERSLGFALRSLERLDGASALNFKAVRASDGMTFAVKCSPASRQKLFGRLVRHLADLEGTKAVRRLFEKECPPVFCGHNVICLSWCSGKRVFPDRLTDAQFAGFLDDYQAFSAAVQKTSGIAPCDPVLQWRETALGKCRGPSGRILGRLIREIPVEDLTYRPELIKVVHGDFHHGNFLFEDGAVAGFFDLEEFCEGYPTDDILRYICCAAEHLKWHEQGRKRRMLDLFGQAVARLPYSRHEWMVAVNARYMNRVYMKTRKSARISLGTALNLFFRALFYRQLRSIVRRRASKSLA